MRAEPLDHLCAAASEQASGFEGGAAKLWTPTPAAGSTRWTWLVVGAVAVGALLGMVLSGQAFAPAAAVVKPADASATGARPHLTAPRTIHGGGPVQVTDDGVTLDLRGIEFRRAVTLLAQATGTRVHGQEALRDRTDGVHLQWKGPELLNAWHVLLGGRVGHTASCRGRECDVWLVGTPAVVAVPVRHPAAAPPNRTLATPPHHAHATPEAVANSRTSTLAHDSPEWVAPSSHGEDQGD